MDRRSLATPPSCSLAPEDREAIRDTLIKITGRAYRTAEEFIRVAQAVVAPALPPNVWRELLGLRRTTSDAALVIRGLPIDNDLPATPAAGGADADALAPIARAALVGVTSPLGEAFGYRGEYDGSLITHVSPARESVGTVSSRGARHLPAHTENVHLTPFRPDYVALLCLRADPWDNGRTLIAHVRDIQWRLSPDTVARLRLPIFRVRAPLSFGAHRGWSTPMPVLTGPEDEPGLSAELTDMVGLTKAAGDALRDLAEACESAATDVAVAPGDLLIIDNRRVVHGRTAFQPRLDGTDRWLLRLFLRAGDLWDWRLYLDDRRLAF